MYGCMDEVAGVLRGVSFSSNSAAFLRIKARYVFMVGSLPVFAKCAVQSDRTASIASDHLQMSACPSLGDDREVVSLCQDEMWSGLSPSLE